MNSWGSSSEFEGHPVSFGDQPVTGNAPLSGKTFPQKYLRSITTTPEKWSATIVVHGKPPDLSPIPREAACHLMLEVLWNKFPQKGAVRLRYFEANVMCMSFVIDMVGLRLGGRIQTTKIKLVNFYTLRISSLLIPWAFLYCNLLTPDASIEWKSANSEIWRFREMFGKNIRRYSKEANKKHPIVVLLHALACYAKWKNYIHASRFSRVS